MLSIYRENRVSLKLNFERPQKITTYDPKLVQNRELQVENVVSRGDEKRQG